VALIVSGSGGTYSSVLKTDVAGQAQLGLIPLPVGYYTVRAYFGGEIPPPVSATYTSPRYNAAAPQSGELAIVDAADTTPPLTSIGSVPPDPSVGAEASFGFSADDNLTPAASLTFECSLDGGTFTECTNPKQYTTLRNGPHTFRVRAVDAAGNRDQTPAFHSWTVTGSSDADTTPPSITISSPTAADYTLGQSVTASYTCADADSGVASCVGSVPSGSLIDTASVGVKTFSVEATDAAGNRATVTVNYRVIYPWTGFFQPVDNLPVFNQVSASRSVPVKFSLGGDRGLSIFAAGYPTSRSITCATGNPVDDIEQPGNAGTSSLSYDPITGQYTYTWKTEKAWAGTCRQFVIRLVDGTDHTASFKFK